MIETKEIIRKRKRRQRIRKLKVLSVVLILISITGYAAYTIVTVTWIIPSSTPSVTLLHPADDESFAVNTTYFNWTGTGGYHTVTPYLWYVWYADTDSTFTSPNLRIIDTNITENYTALPFLDGDWYWRVEVTDNITQNVSETWHFIIQTNASNSFPYLTNPQVSPTSGYITTTFYYNVTYNDPDNDTASMINVSINDTQFTMTETDALDTNSTDGKNYTYSTTMPIGNHNYSFICSDNNATNSTALFFNPSVTVTSAPIISNPVPANDSTGQEFNTEVCITINNADGTLMSAIWYSNSSGSWVVFATDTNLANGTYCHTNTNFSNYSTIYYWNVTVSNKESSTQSDIWHFTTRGPFSNIYPPDNSIDLCPCCDAMCVDIDNTHNMNITIYRNDTQFETFYIINQFLNVSNNTYCFCLDGHINNSIYYPMLYNTTYHWYVNVTDVITNESTESAVFRFTTAENVSNCSYSRDDICPPLETGLAMGIIGGVLGGILGSFLLVKKKKKEVTTYEEERNT